MTFMSELQLLPYRDPPLAAGHVEAEHHAALQLLGDMAVGHPQARVGHVEQDVHHLAGADQHRVLPDQVLLDHSIAGQDQEPAGAVEVERDGAWDGRSSSRSPAGA
jgi:hypothetical protein